MVLIYTRLYERSIKKLKAPERDIKKMEDAISGNPFGGDVVPGLSGIRKARFATSGRGKSGGGRTMYYVQREGDIYLLLAFAKSAQADLTSSQRNQLLDFVQAIKE